MSNHSQRRIQFGSITSSTSTDTVQFGFISNIITDDLKIHDCNGKKNTNVRYDNSGNLYIISFSESCCHKELINYCPYCGLKLKEMKNCNDDKEIILR
jgi:rRNA maturation endonuclease Nob1